jgi:hypothetical protein
LGDIRNKVLSNSSYDPAPDFQKIQETLATKTDRDTGKPAIEWTDRFGTTQKFETPRQFQTEVVKPLQKSLSGLMGINNIEDDDTRDEEMTNLNISSEADLQRQIIETARRYDLAARRHSESLLGISESANDDFFKALEEDDE